MKYYLIFIISCFISGYSAGQSSIPSVEILDTDRGLSQNSVYSLYQDSFGFLWIGTGDGLNRYDGNVIHSYKVPVNAKQARASNFIRGNMAEDERGNIWFTTESGLYRLNRQTYRIEAPYEYERKKDPYGDLQLSFIAPDQTVWMISVATGVASYHIPTANFTFYPHPFPVEAGRVFAARHEHDPQGNIWFSLYRHSGIYKFNTFTHITTHLLEGEDLSFIRFRRGGNYRVGDRSIRYYDSATDAVASLKMEFNSGYERNINDIVDDHGKLWISTVYDGLRSYDLATGTTTIIRNEKNKVSQLPINLLTVLLIDRSRNLWVGTDVAGVCRFPLKPQMFRIQAGSDLAELTKGYFIKAICQEKPDRLWLAPFPDFVRILDLPTGKIYMEKELQKAGIKEVNSFLQDKSGNMWMGYAGGIAVIAKNGTLVSDQSIQISERMRHMPVEKLKELITGEILGTSGPGLLSFRLLRNGQLQANLVTTTFTRAIQAIDETRDRTLWVACKDDGVFKLNREDKGVYTTHAHLLKGFNINCIHADESDPKTVWMGSSNGLIRWNTASEAFHVFNKDDGLAHTTILAIEEDEDHQLWLSTNAGLSCYNRTQNSFLNYSAHDGVQSIAVNSGASCRGSSGNLFFGGVKGFTWFHPRDTKDSPVPAVAITSIRSNDQVLSDDSVRRLSHPLELPYFKNDLAIGVSVFDFSSPENNVVRYRLGGWDNQPSVSHIPEVHYSNLPPGRYTFYFSGSNGNGKWSPERKLEIIILAPFWRQGWFYATVAVAFVSLIILLTRFVSQQKLKLRVADLENLKALEEERRRISMEMHDDIGASLTQITMISEAAKRKSNAGSELEEIARTSRKVVSSMNEIVWSLNPDNRTFDQLMSYLREQIHELLESAEIKYVVHLPEDTTGIPVDNEQKRNIVLLVKEAVHNAVKHSRSETITVTGELSDTHLKVMVEDLGLGFSPNFSATGNGLRSMRRRIRKLGGSMEIKSVPQMGTRVLFQFPLCRGKNEIETNGQHLE